MMKKIYFPGLNGVRFIAAFLVIVDHLELFKNYLNIPAFWSEAYSSHLGQFGVTIFFVLSGFLITYLLLVEKVESGINVKNFYIRRILRIWPLYFIVMLLGFFILPHIPFFNVPTYVGLNDNFWDKFLLFLFFMANVAFVYFPGVLYANVLWSVAVEEQFYIIWPLLIRRFKNIFYLLVVALILYMLLKLFVLLNPFGVIHHSPVKLYKLVNRTRFSAMIIGGLGAVVLHRNYKGVLQLIYNIWIQCIALVALIVLLIVKSDSRVIDYFINEFASVIVIVLILNISSNKLSILKMENKYFNFLGRISYGMYVYHSIVAVLFIKLFSPFLPTSNGLYIIWSLFLLITVTLGTIFVSFLSYNYLERKILNFKLKFSSIESGEKV